MKVNSLVPIIWTADLNRTIDFYVNVIGFTCLANDSSKGWARVKFDNAEIIISRPNNHVTFDKSVFTGTFYFNINNVDEIYSKVNQLAKLCYSIENFDYGMREFAIYDNNGYILQFGQDIVQGD